MIWSEKYRIGAAETDINNIASPSALFRYMQDASDCHMVATGPSYDELLSRGMSFVLSRVSLVLSDKLLHRHDEINVETFATPSRGVAFGRDYRITSGDSLVALASTVWALVDISSGSLVRTGDVELGYGEEPPIDIGMPTRWRIPRELSLDELGRYKVSYADADVNGHMNNTRYPDIFCAFAGDMRGMTPSSMRINFITEAPLGELLFVTGASDGQHRYIRTIREDGKINAEADIVLRKL